MLNQVVIVGKVLEKPILEVDENGMKFTKVVVGVERNFRNSQGEYDVDTITCTVFRLVAEELVNKVDVNDLVGIKGRLQSTDGVLELIGEKTSLLTTTVGD